MAKTKAQVATLALQMLQAVEGDASADTNDQTLAEDAYDMVYGRLRSLHLATWGSTGSVPNECVNPVASLIAEMRMPFFKVPPDAQQMVMNQASKALGDLTEVQNLSYESQVTPIESF